MFVICDPSRYFRVQKRIDAFYKLLVKDSLDREDVEAMEKEKAKNSHEVWQMFRDSNGIYYSFIAKALIQLVFGGTIALLLLWIRFFGLSGEDIKCRVFTQHYVCVVPLASFYASIVIVANMSTIGFLCCSLFTLLWMLFPRFVSSTQAAVQCLLRLDLSQVVSLPPLHAAELRARRQGH